MSRLTHYRDTTQATDQRLFPQPDQQVPNGALAEVPRFDEAITSHQQAAEILGEVGDRRGRGITLNNVGLALRQVHRFNEAHAAWRQALELFVALRADDDADRIRRLQAGTNE